MNFKYIQEHPEVNGGASYLTKIIERQVVDPDGVIMQDESEKRYSIGKEPPYIKIYTDCMLVLNNIDTALSAPLIAFCHHMTWANEPNLAFRHIIRTDQFVREDVARRCGVKDDMVKKWIKKFVETEVFIPIVINNKRKRGAYYVNPWVVGKGEWKDISKLRGEFCLSNDSCRVGSCIIDNENRTRQVFLQDTTPKKSIEEKETS